MTIRFHEPPEITPEMRKSQRAFARSRVSLSRLFQFPFTTSVDIAASLGMPLEAVRWLNMNGHKPRRWLEKTAEHKLWPTNLYRQARLKMHRVPEDAIIPGTVDELYEFVARFQKSSSKGHHFQYRNWFYLEPGDFIFNKEVIEPKTHPLFLNGATAVRFDDDFWICAVLPYRFRLIPIETIIDVLYPEIPKDEIEFRPDSGTPEAEAFYKEEAIKHEAWKIAAQRYEREKWEHLVVRRTSAGFACEFQNENREPVNDILVTEADIEAYRARYRKTDA